MTLPFDEVLLQMILGLVVVVLTVLVMVVRARLRRTAARLNSITALGEFIGGLNDYFRGEYARAITRLEKAVAADPLNVEAHIALGDCHREAGNLAEAHKHHTHVRTTFGVDEVENLRSLALDHEARGDLAAAAVCMEEVHERQPQDLDAAAALRRLRVALGDFIAAAEVQDRLCQTLRRRARRDDEAQARLGAEERELGRLLALAGDQYLERGDPRAAIAHLEHALRLAPDLVGARMRLVEATSRLGEVDQARRLFGEQLQQIAAMATTEGTGPFEPLAPGALRLTAAAEVADGREPGLLPPRIRADEGRLRALVPQPGPSLPAGAVAPVRPRQVLAAVLSREASLRCRDCGQTETRWSELCPCCAAPGTLHSIYTSQWRPVPELIDMVREAAGGRDHHRVLLERASAGDTRAATKLAGLGESAVADIFDDLARLRNPHRAIEILADMGVAAYPEMLEAFVRMSDLASRGIARRRLRGIGTLEDAMVRLSTILGPEVVPPLSEQLARYESALAPLACRVFLQLGAAPELEAHRHRFEPRQVLRALRELEAAQVVRLLAHLPSDATLLPGALADPAWKGDGALVEALGDPDLFECVVTVLRRRGLTAAFRHQSLELLRDEGQADLLLDLLTSLGPEASRAYLTVVTEPTLPAASRARLADHLQTTFEDEPLVLVEALGQGERAAEAELRRAIAACGESGLVAVEQVYRDHCGRVMRRLRPLARGRDRSARHALALALVECAVRRVPGARELALRLQHSEPDRDIRRVLEQAAGTDR